MYLLKTDIKIKIFREDVASVLVKFHAGPFSWSNWNFVGFEEGRGDRRTGRKTLRARRESTTTSTQLWKGSTTLATLPTSKQKASLMDEIRKSTQVESMWIKLYKYAVALYCEISEEAYLREPCTELQHH